jgi:hypothetical protein
LWLDHFALPQIEDFFYGLTGFLFHSSFHLKSGYWSTLFPSKLDQPANSSHQSCPLVKDYLDDVTIGANTEDERS